MTKKSLVLFTNSFPYSGGETFLELEIVYLAKEFERIEIFPMTQGKNGQFDLPENVSVSSIPWDYPVSVRSLFLSDGVRIVGWWLSEMIKSPHRRSYLYQFRWNINRFFGLVDVSNRFLKQIRNLQADVYYSYWFNEWATVLALSKQRGLKGKFIVRAHGYDFDEAQQGRGYHPFRFTEIKYFDRVLPVSEYGLKYMNHKFGERRNVYLSRLGVKDHGPGPINEETKYRIVSCSNFVSLKRIPLIAETLSKLNLEFHWTHFGEGPEREAIETQVGNILAKEKFTFAGFVSNAEFMEFYSKTAVDLFVNMSSLEGIPVSLMEAGSFGIPLVGCKIGGVSEIVCEKTGLLLPANFEIDNTAKEIEAILVNKSRDTKFRKNIRDIVMQKFNAETNYTNFVNRDLGDLS